MKIILPCAGKGTRLGLPYPKEIHLIAEQTALIDLTFLRLKSHADLISEVIVIVAPEKASIIQYLEKWQRDFYIKFIYFNEDNFEWAGSILSAEPEFGEKNIVFLPDSFLVGSPSHPILPTMNSYLNQASASFGYLPCENSEILKSLGALKVRETLITDFCDKPATTDASRYNAFWTTFGFRGEIGRPLLSMMTQSIQRKRVDITSLGGKSLGFPVQEYKDLGVWPNIVDFQQKLEVTETPFPAH